jgi:hypothetical protein
MTDMHDAHRLDDHELLALLHTLVVQSNQTEAQLCAVIAEVDARRLYLPDHISMFAFCTRQLGLSEAAAENRIAVARAGRRFGRVFEALRSGAIHLSGLRVLVPHLTEDSADALLDAAAGKSKRAIEELVARHAPKPDVADSIRKLPQRRTIEAAAAGQTSPLLPVSPLCAEATSASAPQGPAKPPRVSPLSPDRYQVQLTASKELKDKIEKAKALLRHQVPSGDLSTILDKALSALIEKVERQRFGVGRKPRSKKIPEKRAKSRHVPDAIKRAVYERDEGRCTFVGPNGVRCEEKCFLELDHLDGYARKPEHRVSRLTLRCFCHNQYAAELMYGTQWMAERRKGARHTRHPGAGWQASGDKGAACAQPEASALARGPEGGGTDPAGFDKNPARPGAPVGIEALPAPGERA